MSSVHAIVGVAAVKRNYPSVCLSVDIAQKLTVEYSRTI